jgi:hypothetical protein
MENPALQILRAQQVMAISTLRPDGWPQTTFVGYTNQDFSIYFSIFRSSQKFANIQQDDRIAIAVRNEAADLRQVQAVYAAAQTVEVQAGNEREFAWYLFNQRHPALSKFQQFDFSEIAVMRADCKYVTVLDYRKGPGYAEEYTIDEKGAASAATARDDEWGSVIRAG